MSTEKKQKKNSKIEGEGSYTATRNYNSGVAKSVKEGRTRELAEKAKRALEGNEGAELRRAERTGKAGNPKLRKG